MLAGFAYGADVKSQDNPVLVTIEDQQYRLADFQRFIAENVVWQARVTSKEGVDAALTEFIDAGVFRREGLRTNFSAGAGIKDTDAGYYYSVQYSLIGKCPVPNEKELRAYYDANVEKFSTPPLVRTNRLVVPASATIKGQNAEDYLTSQLSDEKVKNIRFSQIKADLKSIVLPESIRQGDMGFKMLSDERTIVGTLDYQLAHANKGAVIGPVLQGEYFYLFEVTDRREPVMSEWDMVSQTRDVERVMHTECTRQRLEAVRKTLYERFNVKLNSEEIDQLTPIGSIGN